MTPADALKLADHKLGCPFCACDRLTRIVTDGTEEWTKCNDCGALGPVEHKGGDRITWNTRALAAGGGEEMVERVADAMQPILEADMDGDDPFVRLDSIEEAARAAISAMPLPAPEEWQDIATAPKDGAAVLLWDGEERFVGEYKDVPGGVLHWQVSIDEHGNEKYASDPQPTHWRPLPAPPRERGEKE